MNKNEPPSFCEAALDRAVHLRGGAQDLWADGAARSVAIWQGKPLCNLKSRSLVRLNKEDALLNHAQEPPVFLGMEGDVPLFASDVSTWTPQEVPDTLGAFLDTSVQAVPHMPTDFGFADLRAMMTTLISNDANIAAISRTLLHWHRSHGFCSCCGAPTRCREGGWRRECETCGAQHFPRTDPVVIMLVTRGERCLLGRSPSFPPGVLSCLAGFVEPGETIEDAVRREVFEETSVHVEKVRYVASQPWPFPSSIMIGCWAQAMSEEIKIDPQELEAATWKSRDEVISAFRTPDPSFKLAMKGSIAYYLLSLWISDILP